MSYKIEIISVVGDKNIYSKKEVDKKLRFL